MPFKLPIVSPRLQRSGNSNVVVIVLIILAVIAVAAVVCGGILIALLLPAVQSARTAARDMSSKNNMKQIGLAMHNYHDVYGAFPPAYVADENGTPMYSWRVLVLPFMEEQYLYEEFNLDEPWDSPQNLPLAELMPETFRHQSYDDGELRPETVYQAIVGPGTVLEGATPTQMRSIVDGTANTAMVVENPTRPVIWTKPDDISPEDFAAGIPFRDAIQGRVNVLFSDGSVHHYDQNSGAAELQRISIRNDGAN